MYSVFEPKSILSETAKWVEVEKIDSEKDKGRREKREKERNK